MTNSRASKSPILLDHHLATGTESTYTFTKNLDMKLQYREITLIITGKATAALAMQLLINAATDYDFAQIEHDTTTGTFAIAAAATELGLLGNVILDGAKPFHLKVTIVLNDATDTYMIQSWASAPHEGQLLYTSEDQTSSTTITSLQIKASTSTWIAGTEITIYGLPR